MDEIVSLIDQYESGEALLLHDYYYYEPWDVERRPDWVIERALEDGVDLREGEIAQIVGPDPHEFQTGYHLSCAPLRALLAGSRLGKSMAALMEALIALTGEIPFALRYPKGYDTGIKRRINERNIRRFGRWRNGELIDHDVTAEPDGTWDCGTIKGVGVFPQQKIVKPGEEVWLGTTYKAIQTYWQRKLDPSDAQCIVPPHFYDTSRAKYGVDRTQGTLTLVHFVRGTKLRLISYETGYNRFEAGQNTRMIILDEEPTDPRIWAASIVRCDYLTIVMTPYNGVTYTKDYVLPKKKRENSKTFHACAYDSPYRDWEKIDNEYRVLQPWERAARIWGAYSEQRGRPYYDRLKINLWLQRYKMPYELSQFVAAQTYCGIRRDPNNGNVPGLMDVRVLRVQMPLGSDMMECWKVYEDVQPNVPYLLTGDTSSGDEDESTQKDVSAALIARFDLERPKIVASIRTKRPVIDFAQMTLLAARYYNNATIAVESAKRGATNAAYYYEARDWPFWFHMEITTYWGKKKREIPGFDTNSKTRDIIFSLIREHLDSFSADQYPEIPDEDLLKELSACIVGKNDRPDHPPDGTLDSAVAFGIMLYVWRYAKDQVQFNGDNERRVSKQVAALEMVRRRQERMYGVEGYVRLPRELMRV